MVKFTPRHRKKPGSTIMDDPAKSNQAGNNSHPDSAARPLVHRSQDLLQGRSEVWIEHEGVMYRLRLTSAGKLYLTK